MRVTGHSHLVFLCHRNDAFQEIGDALPILVGADRPCLRQRRILLRFLVYESAVTRAAPARSRRGADDAQNAHVVFQRLDPGRRRIPDHLADVVDLTIALRAFPQHDVRHFSLRDIVRAER